MQNHIEIEKKYIIEKPDPEVLWRTEGCKSTKIVQIYLESPIGKTHRIRKRTDDGVSVYTETVKVRIDRMSAFEDEREITEERFVELSAKIKQGTRPIEKTRVSFPYRGRVIELDFYPEWKRTCIMEIELEKRDGETEIPPFIRILRDVTGERAYSNASMSHAFPKEEEL